MNGAPWFRGAPLLALALLLSVAGAGLPARAGTVRVKQTRIDPRSGQVVTLWSLKDSEGPTSPAEERRPSLRGENGDELPGSGWTVSANTRLDGTGTDSDSPSRAAVRVGPSGELCAVWEDNEYSTGGIRLAYSLDGGATWSSPESVHPVAVTTAITPMLEFTPSGEVVVVWDTRIQNEDAWETLLRKRRPVTTSDGWGPVVLVGPQSELGGNTRIPSVAVVDDQRYFVTWTDGRIGEGYQIYFRRTDDGGTSWSNPARVTIAGYLDDAKDSSLCVDLFAREPGSERIYVTASEWRQGSGGVPDVYSHRSDDGGLHWSAGIRVNDITSGFQQVYRSNLSQTEDGTLWALWFHSGAGSEDVRLAHSSDRGSSWSPSIVVEHLIPSHFPFIYSSLTALGNRVAVGYSMGSGTEDQAYVRISDTVGAPAFTSPIVLSDAPSPLNSPQDVVVALAPGVVHALWEDVRYSPYSAMWAVSARPAVSGIDSAVRSRETRRARLVLSPSPARGSDAPCAFLVRGGERTRFVLSGAGQRQGSVWYIGPSGAVNGRGGWTASATGEVELSAPQPALAPGVYFVTMEAGGRRLGLGKWCVVR